MHYPIPRALSFASLISLLLLSSPDSVRAETGVTPERILLGATSSTAPVFKETSADFREGYQLYFDRINQEGGIGGRKIEVNAYDDLSEGKAGVEAVRKLINADHVFALFGVFGSKTASAILPMVSSQSVPMFAPSTGSDTLVRPIKKEVFVAKALASDEIEGLVRQLTEKDGVRQIAITYRNNTFGRPALNGLQKALSDRGIKAVAALPFDGAEDSEVKPIVAKIAASGAKAVLIWGAEEEVVTFLKAFDAKGVKARFLGPSVLQTPKFIKSAGPLAEGFMIAAAFPSIHWDSSPLIKLVKQDMKKTGKSVMGPYGIQGYFSAALFAEAIKRAGSDLTRAKLLDAIESMSDFEFGGIKVEFSKANHQATHQVFMTGIRNGQYEPL